MTFKEINQDIHHYEEELKKCYLEILKLARVLQIETKTENVAFLNLQKSRIEFFCFVTTSYIDILCVYRNIKRSKSDWEKYFSIKLAYLVAYETINTYHKYRGEIYKSISKDEKSLYKRFFDMLNRELSDFKSEFEYNKVMPTIRNKSIAHYDKNFSEFYTTFDLLKKFVDKDIVRSFLYFVNPLHYFSNALMNNEIDDVLFTQSWMI